MELQEEINLHKNNFFNALKQAEFTHKSEIVNQNYWFGSVIKSLYSLKTDSKKLFIIGNGASASISDHFAADISKNAKIPTFSNTEAALITGFSNDFSYENAQVEILKRKMCNGDGIILISSSGNSKNLINVAELLLQYYTETTIITLTSFKGSNPLRCLGHYNLYVPALTYGIAESAHAYYLHLLTDLLFDYINP